MTGPHHADPIEQNIDAHPLKLAVGLVVGAIALIVGIYLLVQFAVGVYGARSLKDDPAMSEAAVAKRIAPVAMVAIDPIAPPPAAAPGSAAAPAQAAMAAPAIPPAAPKAAQAAASGKATFDSVCAVCHGTGVAGAPKLGDKAVWAPRIKTGKDALYATALHGKGAMPAKGGNPKLSDADVKAAVDYMVSAAK